MKWKKHPIFQELMSVKSREEFLVKCDLRTAIQGCIESLEKNKWKILKQKQNQITARTKINLLMEFPIGLKISFTPMNDEVLININGRLYWHYLFMNRHILESEIRWLRKDIQYYSSHGRLINGFHLDEDDIKDASTGIVTGFKS